MSDTSIRQPDHWVPKVAVLLAVVGSATIGWLAFGRSADSGASPSSIVTESAAVDSSTTTAAPTSVTDTTAVTTTVAPETTVAPTIAPETTLPPPPPVETAAVAPPSAVVIDPTPGALSGPGNHQILNDTMASGAPLADVLPMFATAQRLADAIAADDFAGANAMLPTYPYGAEGLAATYVSVDRFSLMLIDARPDNGGFTLLMAGITNEAGGARTSERCLRWYADTAAVEFQGESLLMAFDVAFSAVELRTNSDEDQRIRNGCVW